MHERNWILIQHLVASDNGSSEKPKPKCYMKIILKPSLSLLLRFSVEDYCRKMVHCPKCRLSYVKFGFTEINCL